MTRASSSQASRARGACCSTFARVRRAGTLTRRTRAGVRRCAFHSGELRDHAFPLPGRGTIKLTADAPDGESAVDDKAERADSAGSVATGVLVRRSGDDRDRERDNCHTRRYARWRVRDAALPLFAGPVRGRSPGQPPLRKHDGRPCFRSDHFTGATCRGIEGARHFARLETP